MWAAMAFLVFLAACSSAQQVLPAEAYPYYDECVFIDDQIQQDCMEYARLVYENQQEQLPEMCVFSTLNCIVSSAEVRLTDIYVTTVFDQEISQAEINFNGLIRECSTNQQTVTCSLPIVQIDREFKQPFMLTVDGHKGRLLVYV